MRGFEMRHIRREWFGAPLLSFLLALAALFALATAGNVAEQAAFSPDEFGDWEDLPLTPPQEENAAADDAGDAVAPAEESEESGEENWLEYRIRRGDTMGKILAAVHAKDDIRNLLLTQKFKTHRRLVAGKKVHFKMDGGGRLSALLYKTSPDYYLTAGYDAATGAPWAKEEAPVVNIRRRAAGARIDTSLFAAADAAGMSDAAISRLIEALETQIDFYRDVRKNDSFRVVYDAWTDEHGDLIKIGDVRAFEYVNHKSAKPRLIRGALHAGDGNYYSPAGESLQRAFLPAPLKYRRISSKFSRNRFHPVLKKWRPHRGVDYAAPTGTPVRATADGVISKVERQRGYGRVVMIKHFNNVYTTVYAHLHRFAKNTRRGRRVKQGQIIGYVGQSGLATGPHLHYEFRVRGKHKDPLSVSLPKQLPPLKGDALAAFQRESESLFAEMGAINLQ